MTWKDHVTTNQYIQHRFKLSQCRRELPLWLHKPVQASEHETKVLGQFSTSTEQSVIRQGSGCRKQNIIQIKLKCHRQYPKFIGLMNSSWNFCILPRTGNKISLEWMVKKPLQSY